MGTEGRKAEPGCRDTGRNLSGGSCSPEHAWSLPGTIPQAESWRNGLAPPYLVPFRFLQGPLVSKTQLEAS